MSILNDSSTSEDWTALSSRPVHTSSDQSDGVSYLAQFLSDNDKLKHGFCQSHSCQTQLLENITSLISWGLLLHKPDGPSDATLLIKCFMGKHASLPIYCLFFFIKLEIFLGNMSPDLWTTIPPPTPPTCTSVYSACASHRKIFFNKTLPNSRMSASAFLVPSCCISILYEHLCEQFLFTPVSLTLEWCMMNKVSKHYFLYTLFLLAKQQVARPEPNVLFFCLIFCSAILTTLP